MDSSKMRQNYRKPNKHRERIIPKRKLERRVNNLNSCLPTNKWLVRVTMGLNPLSKWLLLFKSWLLCIEKSPNKILMLNLILYTRLWPRDFSFHLVAIFISHRRHSIWPHYSSSLATTQASLMMQLMFSWAARLSTPVSS